MAPERPLVPGRVDVCWNAKKGQIRECERPAAKKAYDEAKKIYDETLKVSSAD